MEKVQICCMKGTGSGTKPYKIIPLEGKLEATIGRTEDNTVSIPSNMISRRHALLNKNLEGQWTITDNKSLNGIFINGTRLEAMVAHTLTDRDVVQLGVKTASGQPAEFVWTFFEKLGVKKIRSGINSSQQDYQSQENSQKDVLKPSSHTTNRKRPSDENSPQASPSKRSPGKASARNPCKRPKVGSSDVWSPSAEMKRRLEEQDQKAKEQLKEQQERLAEMQRLLAEKESAKEKLEAELQEKEQAMREELKKQQENLVAERKRFEEEMKQNYEEQIKDKETSLLSRLAEEKNRLVEEKKRIEQTLQNELETKLGEKDKDYQEQLLREKESLDKVIEQKALHQKMLETELNEMKTENSKHKESALHAKEDILANFTELIETELQCSICSELFVRATSLNCSHSYCAHCIEQWMKVKKECPNCRAPITSHLRSIVLDSYIDRMVDHLSTDMKEKRKQLVAERKAEEEAEKAKNAAANKAANTSGRGRTRGGRGGRGQTTQRAAPPPEAPGASGIQTRSRVDADAVLISSDRDDDVGDHWSDWSDEDNSDESSSSVEGIEGAYFGGYGACYRCGSRGHWVNGCPY